MDKKCESTIPVSNHISTCEQDNSNSPLLRSIPAFINSLPANCLLWCIRVKICSVYNLENIMSLKNRVFCTYTILDDKLCFENKSWDHHFMGRACVFESFSSHFFLSNEESLEILVDRIQDFTVTFHNDNFCDSRNINEPNVGADINQILNTIDLKHSDCKTTYERIQDRIRQRKMNNSPLSFVREKGNEKNAITGLESTDHRFRKCPTPQKQKVQFFSRNDLMANNNSNTNEMERTRSAQESDNNFSWWSFDPTLKSKHSNNEEKLCVDNKGCDSDSQDNDARIDIVQARIKLKKELISKG